MKKIRTEVLGLTMEGLAEIMGISKGHIAKLEGGTVDATTTLQLLFWDIVERVLKNKGMEWNELPAAAEAGHLTGEEAVLNLVPDAYKKDEVGSPIKILCGSIQKPLRILMGRTAWLLLGTPLQFCKPNFLRKWRTSCWRLSKSRN